jgi:hypothetical protein
MEGLVDLPVLSADWVDGRRLMRPSKFRSPCQEATRSETEKVGPTLVSNFIFISAISPAVYLLLESRQRSPKLALECERIESVVGSRVGD